MEPVFEEQFSTACIYDGQLFSFSLNPVMDDKYLTELIRILLIKKMSIASINNTKTDENDKMCWDPTMCQSLCKGLSCKDV